MTSAVTNYIKAAALISLALAIGAMGIYVAQADDAPGAAGIGLLLMIGAVVVAAKVARNRLGAWAARAALAVGVLIAAFAAFLTHAVAVTVPLFAHPQDVPSVIDSAPSAQYAAAVERVRGLVRSRRRAQKVPRARERRSAPDPDRTRCPGSRRANVGGPIATASRPERRAETSR